MIWKAEMVYMIFKFILTSIIHLWKVCNTVFIYNSHYLFTESVIYLKLIVN